MGQVHSRFVVDLFGGWQGLLLFLPFSLLGDFTVKVDIGLPDTEALSAKSLSLQRGN